MSAIEDLQRWIEISDNRVTNGQVGQVRYDTRITVLIDKCKREHKLSQIRDLRDQIISNYKTVIGSLTRMDVISAFRVWIYSIFREILLNDMASYSGWRIFSRAAQNYIYKEDSKVKHTIGYATPPYCAILANRNNTLRLSVHGHAVVANMQPLSEIHPAVDICANPYTVYAGYLYSANNSDNSIWQPALFIPLYHKTLKRNNPVLQTALVTTAHKLLKEMTVNHNKTHLRSDTRNRIIRLYQHTNVDVESRHTLYNDIENIMSSA